MRAPEVIRSDSWANTQEPSSSATHDGQEQFASDSRKGVFLQGSTCSIAQLRKYSRNAAWDCHHFPGAGADAREGAGTVTLIRPSSVE